MWCFAYFVKVQLFDGMQHNDHTDVKSYYKICYGATKPIWNYKA